MKAFINHLSNCWRRALARTRKDVRRAVRSRSGNVALIAALATPALLGAAGGAMDFASVSAASNALQSVADASALAAASELRLRTTNDSTVDAIVNSFVDESRDRLQGEVSAASAILAQRAGVEVELEARIESIFGDMFSEGGYVVRAESIARLAGGTPLCMLSLNSSANGAISLEANGRVLGNGCAIVSNSRHRSSIKSKDSSEMEAALICTAGGVEGGRGHFEPEPVTDCPPIPDPLAGRAEIQPGLCDYINLLILPTPTRLRPGTYCGGLRVPRGAKITLDPGIYVMTQGSLTVEDGGELIGQNVAFYMHGILGKFEFRPESTIDLTAPRTGPLAGFLFFADRGTKLRRFRINSNNARNLLGTIYLPGSTLEVAARRPIADRSAYTVIVADKIEVSEGPILVLNADYDQTNIPVPNGVGPRAPQAYLAD